MKKLMLATMVAAVALAAPAGVREPVIVGL